MQSRLLGLFGFALMAAYWPWANAATSPRWLVLVAALFLLPLLPLDRNWQPPALTWLHLLGGAFILWAWASWLWSAAPYDTMGRLTEITIYTGIFILGSWLPNLRAFWIGAALGIGVSSVLVILDVAGLIEYAQKSRPSGLFVNGLYLAEAAALVLVANWRNAWGKGPGLALVAPSLLLVWLPRGPLLALSACGLAWLWKRSRRIAGVAMVLLLVASGVALMHRPDSASDRLAMWSDALHHLTLFGHGFGTYAHLAPLIGELYDPGIRVETHPHNLFVEIAFELGLPGALLATAFCIVALVPGRCRPVICAFLIEASLGFAFSLPSTGAPFVLACGHACRDLRSWRHALGHGRDRLSRWVHGERSAGEDRSADGCGTVVALRSEVPNRPGADAIRNGALDAGRGRGG